MYKKLEVSSLKRASLNWAVAKCEGYDCQFDDEVAGAWLVPQNGYLHDEKPLSRFTPSTDWSQGGPIIDREKMSVLPFDDIWEVRCKSGIPRTVRFVEHRGPTPLIAAMRCYVASKLGNTIEVPEELL